jgi:hypothetical protein
MLARQLVRGLVERRAAGSGADLGVGGGGDAGKPDREQAEDKRESGHQPMLDAGGFYPP